MRIWSPNFPDGGEIPMRNTQEAEDFSPALVFEDVPPKAQSLVLIVDDPDAPDPRAPKCVWLHWLVVNLPGQCGGLEEGVKTLPGSALEGINDGNEKGWSGPRPPIGVHRYYFRLYALDCTLNPTPDFRREAVEQAMVGHVLAQTQMHGTYLLSSNRYR